MITVFFICFFILRSGQNYPAAGEFTARSAGGLYSRKADPDRMSECCVQTGPDVIFNTDMEWLPAHERVRTCCFHNTKLPLLAQCRAGNGLRRTIWWRKNMRECPPDGSAPVSAGTVRARKYFCSCWRFPLSQRCLACTRFWRTDMQTLTRVLPPLRLIMFCQSGENPAQFPDTDGLCVEDCVRLRTPEGLLDRLRRWPGAMVISAGRPSTQLLLWQQVFQCYPRTVVFCSSNAFLPIDVSVEGYFRHLRLVKRAMPVRVLARMAELAIWSSVQASPYKEEMKNALSVPELVMEINSRTLVRLLSERLPKQGRRVLGLLLSGCSPEMTARILGTGVRQVWLAEQTLKQRWDIPSGIPLLDAIRIRMPDVNRDINQQIVLVKAAASNASDLR